MARRGLTGTRLRLSQRNPRENELEDLDAEARFLQRGTEPAPFREMPVEWPDWETGAVLALPCLETVPALARRRLEAGRRPGLELESPPDWEQGAAIPVPVTAPALRDQEAEAALRERNSAAPAGAMVDDESRGAGPR